MCVYVCVCVCVSVLSYHLVSYVAVMTTNHNQASKKTAIGPIVIGFFVFVIVGEGTRNAFSDSPCDHVCCCCTLKIKDALIAASFVCIYTDENSFSLCVCVCVCESSRSSFLLACMCATCSASICGGVFVYTTQPSCSCCGCTPTEDTAAVMATCGDTLRRPETPTQKTII